MNRPKKGFSVPVSVWLKDGKMREWAECVLADSREITKDYLDMKLVESIWKDYLDNGKWNSTIWYILMLEQWLLHEKCK